MTAPWLSEPDTDSWEYAGLACSIHRHPTMGHLCGYVGVPTDHPLYGVHYTSNSRYLPSSDPDNPTSSPEAEFEVHGGITYSGDGRFLIGVPPSLWWFGFDCAHSEDVSPNLPSSNLPLPTFSGRRPVYRDMAFVRKEAERLANQIACVRKEGETE